MAEDDDTEIILGTSYGLALTRADIDRIREAGGPQWLIDRAEVAMRECWWESRRKYWRSVSRFW